MSRATTSAPLHALFATMATELDAYTDLVAERLVVLGGVARGTARTAATHSTLPEYPGALMDGDAHVRALAERFAPYATALRADIAHATDVEDAGSAALYTDISRGVDHGSGLGSVPPPLTGHKEASSAGCREPRGGESGIHMGLCLAESQTTCKQLVAPASAPWWKRSWSM